MNPIPFGLMLQSFTFIALWFGFVISLHVLFSSVLKAPGLVAFLTVTSAFVLSMQTNMFEQWFSGVPQDG